MKYNFFESTNDFTNRCVIESLPRGAYRITEPNGMVREITAYEETGELKPTFTNDRGEKVIELEGMAVKNKNPNESLAEVTVAPGGSSEFHYHTDRTEVYYILHGNAEVILNDRVHQLNAGQQLIIPRGYKHQVFNKTPESGQLVLMVRCTPSWSFEDHHRVSEPVQGAVTFRR